MNLGKITKTLADSLKKNEGLDAVEQAMKEKGDDKKLATIGKKIQALAKQQADAMKEFKAALEEGDKKKK